MNRLEAVALLQSLSELLSEADVSSIKLIEPADGTVGFQVRVRAFFDLSLMRQIREMCNKQKLSVALDNGEVVIYKSKE